MPSGGTGPELAEVWRVIASACMTSAPPAAPKE
jgi:hypothetical protein